MNKRQLIILWSTGISICLFFTKSILQPALVIPILVIGLLLFWTFKDIKTPLTKRFILITILILSGLFSLWICLWVNTDYSFWYDTRPSYSHRTRGEGLKGKKTTTTLKRIPSSEETKLKGIRLDDLEEKLEEQKEELLQASWDGKIKTVQALLEKGADVNAKTEDGFFALMYASQNGHTDIVKLLLKEGADINAKDDNSWTALIWASSMGRTDTVKLLIEKGADVNVKDHKGYTALVWAYKLGRTDIVELLEQAGGVYTFLADINEDLLKASRDGKIKTVQALLEKGADVNTKNNYGVTALIFASSMGHTDIVKLLIEKGAEVNAKTTDSYTALIWASKNGHTDIVGLLKQAGVVNTIADIAFVDLNEKLVEASGKGNVGIVKTLIDKGADVNAKESKYGLTALILASCEGYTDTIKLLIENGADVNAKDNVHGWTALMNASSRGYIDAVELLVEKGADVNAKNHNGNTALTMASTMGRTDIMKLLKQAGAKE